MTVLVKHSTLADGSFSATGATAWNADHTLTGVGTMAEQNANNVAITGGSITGSVVSGNITGNAANVTGTVAIVNGGTGQTTQAAALTAISGTQTSGKYLRSNGTNTALATIVAADVPTLNQNTTGSAGSVTNALTAGTGISLNSGTTYDGSAAKTISSLLAKQTDVFTSATAATYTAPANTQWVKVTVVGPGGNGNGAVSQRGSGGGGGGVAIKWLAMTAGQTLTYTVGTSSGTNSSVSSGTLIITTITSGSGNNGFSTAYAAGSQGGGAGGYASGGDININGGTGGISYGTGTSIATQVSGVGGNCPGFGSGGINTAAGISNGGNAQGNGGGGSGSIGNTSFGTGGPGVIIFEAY